MFDKSCKDDMSDKDDDISTGGLIFLFFIFFLLVYFLPSFTPSLGDLLKKQEEREKLKIKQ